MPFHFQLTFITARVDITLISYYLYLSLPPSVPQNRYQPEPTHSNLSIGAYAANYRDYRLDPHVLCVYRPNPLKAKAEKASSTGSLGFPRLLYSFLKADF